MVTQITIGDEKQMKDKEYKCITPRCTKEPEINVMGKWMCGRCWHDHCKGDEQ